MTKQQFDDLYLGKAVHCDTEEKANEFLALAHSFGYGWKYGTASFLERKAYDIYESQTCYEIKAGLYGRLELYADDDYEIIEYELGGLK